MKFKHILLFTFLSIKKYKNNYIIATNNNDDKDYKDDNKKFNN